MKKIVGLGILLFSVGLLGACGGNSSENPPISESPASIAESTEESLDLTVYTIPEIVKNISKNSSEEFVPADTLTVSQGTYDDGTKAIVELIGDDSGDSLVAQLNSDSSVEKFIFRGNDVKKLFLFVDSIENVNGGSTPLLDDIQNSIDNEQSLEELYESDSYNYDLKFDINRSEPLKVATLIVTPKENVLTQQSSDDSNSSSASQENFVSDGPITEIGQWTYRNDGYGGEAHLVGTFDEALSKELIPGFSINIDSVKLFKNIGLQNTFSEDTGIDASKVKDDSYFLIQVVYTSSNDTDSEKDFYGIQYITTDQREQIEVLPNNFAEGYIEAHFQPNVDVQNVVMVPINPDNAENIEKINLTLNSIENEDGSYTDPEPIEITLKK